MSEQLVNGVRLTSLVEIQAGTKFAEDFCLWAFKVSYVQEFMVTAAVVMPVMARFIGSATRVRTAAAHSVGCVGGGRDSTLACQ